MGRPKDDSKSVTSGMTHVYNAVMKQCYFSSRNHLYSSFHSVHIEINLVLVQILFF